MNRNNIDSYRLSDEKEKTLWDEAIFVFDSSAILDLYFVPKFAREKIYSGIFKKLESRLWLPSQVEFEYLKNREKIIKKPISEKYEPLKGKIKKITPSVKNEVVKRIEEIKRETLKADKHPHIEQKEIDELKKSADKFLSELKTFEDSLIKKIAIVETEILDVEDNDDVLKSLEDFFVTGREFSFEEILDITKEGKHRYEFKIPPGYGDLQSKEKKGTQIFGDLIIWKQILEYSKEVKKPIIFITNDIKKDEDWCHLDKSATEDRIESPRAELIKEIKDNSGVDFWMYNLPQLLYNANKFIQSEIKEETIQNITQFLHTKQKKSSQLRFKCNNCGKIHSYDESELNLDFDCVGGSERNMGTENQYVAEEYFDCDCGKNIEVKFEVWEYPIGVHNYDSLTIDGAKILESFHFTVDFFDDETEPDFCTCHTCSGNRDGMGNFVSFWGNIDLDNEYDSDNPNSKYHSVVSGNCDWCNSLHIKCPKCGTINLMGEFQNNENIECEGGCGLIFKVDTSNDTDNIGDFDLKLIDHRITKCSSCGENFIDKSQTEICEVCEEKYNNE